MPRGRKPALPVEEVKKKVEVVEEVEEVESKYQGVNIDLDSQYTMTSDKYQYIINRKGINRSTGENKVEPISYHATVEQAINSIAEKELRTRTAKSYAELLKNSNDIKVEIREMYKILNEVPSRPIKQ